jgi:3-oxoacyl-[acyl-carrier-protein] synthase II
LIFPNEDGITRTVRFGLQDGRLDPGAVDFISAHATATKMGDVVEAQSIHNIFGDGPLVTGLKSYMGHTMGSCGAIELIMTLYMMQDGFVVPTLNLDEIDNRCAMIRHVPEVGRADIRIAGIQNFAFGGVNTSIFIKKI